MGFVPIFFVCLTVYDHQTVPDSYIVSLIARYFNLKRFLLTFDNRTLK
jgi:hypothetical protein